MSYITKITIAVEKSDIILLLDVIEAYKWERNIESATKRIRFAVERWEGK
uniref:Uncharacterized protein n=1 Tax=viral metagenome TaxID=1070528 RepID=A0A6M3K2D8_9ZZZZ